MIRVALDAMGGDDAPRVEVEGALQALREFPPTFRIQLVGRTGDIEAALQTHGAVDRARLEIVEAPEVVGMGEKPLAAVKSKPHSSVAVGIGQRDVEPLEQGVIPCELALGVHRATGELPQVDL